MLPKKALCFGLASIQNTYFNNIMEKTAHVLQLFAFFFSTHSLVRSRFECSIFRRSQQITTSRLVIS